MQNAVKDIEEHLARKREQLSPRTKSPWFSGYRPETDITPELSSSDATYYQSLIGVLQMIVELNRVDITIETSVLASLTELPREGHLKELFHIFSFLKGKHRAAMLVDPTEPDLNESIFKNEDWSATAYVEYKEKMPSNASKSRRIDFTTRAFVDSDDAGDCITR